MLDVQVYVDVFDASAMSYVIFKFHINELS